LENRFIELLAPARDLETGRVAVDCGADAVYIGGPGFGARRAAGNSLPDVAALVRYARPFGVRVYATMNTLVFDKELDEARAVAQGLIDAGVDAIIVQDMAFARLHLPGASGGAGEAGVEFHASTQTSNIDPEGVAFLGRAGFSRVILERALSIDEIRAIRAATPEQTELEVFVHGAICVGYSGRCFMSRAAGEGRSGNRGDCSQPCRLAYDLVDGDGKVIIAGKHLLSVRDLDLSARIGELMDAGVSSFKIEGRLKDAGYVRNVVSYYRKVIDRELSLRNGGKVAGRLFARSSVGRSVPDFNPDPAKSFTRGASEYFFDGLPNRLVSQAAAGPRVEGRGRLSENFSGVASFDTPKSIGEPVGEVERVECERTGNRYFTLRGDGDGNAHGELLSAGDGVCFFVNGKLRGTSINRVEGARVYPNDMEGIAPGIEIRRNHDHEFARALFRSRMRRKIAATARVDISTEPMQPLPSGNPHDAHDGQTRIEITFTDETGVSVNVARTGQFDPAQNPEKMAATMREQLAKSGDTIFEVRSVTISGDGPNGSPARLEFIPASLLAQMRREGLEKLLDARMQLPPVRRPATEDPTVRAPKTTLAPQESVTNHLAERFWRDHGVTEFAPSMELRPIEPGETVMRTRYCIRREIGQCLLDNPTIGGDLFLIHANTRWRLNFNCKDCFTEIIKT
jgi:putative protease